MTTHATLPDLLLSPPWERDDAIRLTKKEWFRAKSSVHVPARLPAIPGVLDVDQLTRPTTTEGLELTSGALENLLVMLTFNSPALPQVMAQLDQASVAQLMRDSLMAWLDGDMPGDRPWMWAQQGTYGDAKTIDMLASLIEEWPKQRRVAKAQEAVGMIASIGGSTAAATLVRLHARVTSRALKESIERQLLRIAKDLNLTPDQLADRSVPSDGFDEAIELDFGSRSFTVAFNQELDPVLRDKTGKIRKTFPRAAVADDPELVDAAKQRFTKLRTDVRRIAKIERARLEEAMVRQRRWSHDEFLEFIVEHPLMVHLARGVVWGTSSPTGELDTTFRITEDRTFADEHDEAMVLDESRTIFVVHPILLDDSRLTQWSTLFADYELLQPFDQLARPCHRLTDAEVESTDLRRFCDDREHEVFSLLALEKRGWNRAMTSDAHVIELSKHLGRTVHVRFDVGIYTPHPPSSEPSRIIGIHLDNGSAFRSLQPAYASELLRDLLDTFGQPGEPVAAPVAQPVTTPRASSQPSPRAVTPRRVPPATPLQPQSTPKPTPVSAAAPSEPARLSLGARIFSLLRRIFL